MSLARAIDVALWEGFDFIQDSNGVMNLFLNREDYRLFLERIRKVTAGVFLSSPGGFHLGLLPAQQARRVFPPSPSFLNLPGMVGDEGRPDSFLSRPVLSANPVFDFRVA